MADENKKINDELNEKELAAEEIKGVAGGYADASLVGLKRPAVNLIKEHDAPSLIAPKDAPSLIAPKDEPSLIAPNKDLISPNAPIPAAVADLGAQLGAAPLKGTDT